jgi:hypothetical protein
MAQTKKAIEDMQAGRLLISDKQKAKLLRQHEEAGAGMTMPEVMKQTDEIRRKNPTAALEYAFQETDSAKRDKAIESAHAGNKNMTSSDINGTYIGHLNEDNMSRMRAYELAKSAVDNRGTDKGDKIAGFAGVDIDAIEQKYADEKPQARRGKIIEEISRQVQAKQDAYMSDPRNADKMTDAERGRLGATLVKNVGEQSGERLAQTVNGLPAGLISPQVVSALAAGGNAGLLADRLEAGQITIDAKQLTTDPNLSKQLADALLPEGVAKMKDQGLAEIIRQNFKGSAQDYLDAGGGLGGVIKGYDERSGNISNNEGRNDFEGWIDRGFLSDKVRNISANTLVANGGINDTAQAVAKRMSVEDMKAVVNTGDLDKVAALVASLKSISKSPKADAEAKSNAEILMKEIGKGGSLHAQISGMTYGARAYSGAAMVTGAGAGGVATAAGAAVRGVRAAGRGVNKGIDVGMNLAIGIDEPDAKAVKKVIKDAVKRSGETVAQAAREAGAGAVAGAGRVVTAGRTVRGRAGKVRRKLF